MHLELGNNTHRVSYNPDDLLKYMKTFIKIKDRLCVDRSTVQGDISTITLRIGLVLQYIHKHNVCNKTRYAETIPQPIKTCKYIKRPNTFKHRRLEDIKLKIPSNE